MEQANTRGVGRYTGLLMVDVNRFDATHNSAQQHQIIQLLPVVLREAAEQARIPQLLQDNDFHAFRGDGYFIGFDPDLAAKVVDRYFDALQANLRSRTPSLRAKGIELRLRASLHVAPVHDYDRMIADSPTGSSANEAKRMVDANAVRALLQHSDPRVTLVATVVSSDAMKHVVEAGLTSRQPTEFVAAPMQVESKEFSGTGYLRVPVPSGDLLRHGLLHGQPVQGEPSTLGNASRPVSSSELAEQAVQAEKGADECRTAYTAAGGTSVVASGDRSTAAYGNVDQSSHKQEFSGTFRTKGDANFGPSSGRRQWGTDEHEGR